MLINQLFYNLKFSYIIKLSNSSYFLISLISNVSLETLLNPKRFHLKIVFWSIHYTKTDWPFLHPFCGHHKRDSLDRQLIVYFFLEYRSSSHRCLLILFPASRLWKELFWINFYEANIFVQIRFNCLSFLPWCF